MSATSFDALRNEVRPQPDRRGAERARLILDFHEGPDHVHTAETGWALIEGPWVCWFGDADGHWQSWPIHNVVCVGWRAPMAKITEQTEAGS